MTAGHRLGACSMVAFPTHAHRGQRSQGETMLASPRQDPILRSSHSVIPLLVLSLSLSLALGACGDTDSPLAPGSTDEAPVTADEAPQASAPEAVVATLSTQRIAFASYRNGNQDIYLMDPQGYSVK